MAPKASRAVKASLGILAAVSLGVGGYAWASSDGTPSCAWPLRIHGEASSEQAGLLRCYLQALAEHDEAGLYAVAAKTPRVRITAADFKYSTDARAGMVTATLMPSPVDPTGVLVVIKFGDGLVEKAGMINEIAMGGPSTWRMAVGTQLGR